MVCKKRCVVLFCLVFVIVLIVAIEAQNNDLSISEGVKDISDQVSSETQEVMSIKVGDSKLRLDDESIVGGVTKLIEVINKLIMMINIPEINISANDVIKFLYALILYLFIYSAVNMFGFFDSDRNWINIVLALSITVVAYIALPTDYIEYLIPGYKAMGSFFLTALPFIGILYISVVSKKQLIGRILWLIVIVLGIVMFFEHGIPAFGGTLGNGFIYLGMSLLGIVMIIFMPGLRSWFFHGKMEELENEMESNSKIEAEIKRSRLKEARATRDLQDLN